MKKCSGCKLEKPLSDFCKDKNRKDGLRCYCLLCRQRNNKKLVGKYLKRQKDYHQTINGRYVMYRQSAKRRCMDFELTPEQFFSLTVQTCYFCGEVSKDRNYVGIDRLNTNFGYKFDNCVPCCNTCNFMKRKMSQQEFIDKVYKIYGNFANNKVGISMKTES